MDAVSIIYILTRKIVTYVPSHYNRLKNFEIIIISSIYYFLLFLEVFLIQTKVITSIIILNWGMNINDMLQNCVGLLIVVQIKDIVNEFLYQNEISKEV